MSERAEWEKHKNYPPNWSWATWPERTQIVLAWTIASAIGLAMAVAALVVLGSIGDGVSRYNSEHERCLKNSTNGYEIRQCR
jgi:hypothetical protein